jgi:hypothetical protein
LPRQRTTAPAPQAPAAADVQPQTINPTSVYSKQQFQAAFALTKESTRREVRLGRLKVARRGGRYWILGEWIIDWLRAGQVRPRQSADQGSAITPEGGERPRGTAPEFPKKIEP